MGTKVIVGIAGSGKTSNAMGIIEARLQNGLRTNQIGFASFSKAAVAEAAQRAARLTGEDASGLQRNGWFRTLHSCALRCLGIDTKAILDHDSVDGKKFLKDAVGCERGGDPGTLGSKVDEILSAWDYCRAKLLLLSDTDRESRTHTENPGHTGHTKTHERHTNSRVCPPAQSVTQQALTSSETDENTRISRIGEFQNKSTTDSKSFDLCVRVSSTEYNSYRDKDLGGGHIPRVVCPGVGRVSSNRVNEGAIGKIHANKTLIQAYEREKALYGRLDFTDLLLLFTGIVVKDDLSFVQEYPKGQVPEEIEVWLMDEMQDASDLLGMVAERISESAAETFWLGDAYQSVYAFSGASAAVFAAKEDDAKQEGNRILLNRSWRNPPQILEWGEEILREDKDYDERKPISEVVDVSVGLMDSEDFMKCLPKLAGSDSMILARTWHSLLKVKERLDNAQVPWKSMNEKQGSRWSCPAKIWYTLVMRALMAGEKISEQDFRKVCETLPQKFHGVEMFTRGVKAKWKKLKCSGENVRTLNELEEWGATQGFREFVTQGRWRVDMMLLLDVAIEKFGIKEVRDPSIRIGTVHASKGAEARNVFCLAASTGRIERDGDPAEELCLRYVAVTRSAKHFRLVVDQVDLARGKALFWPAPKGEKTYLKGMPDVGVRHSVEDYSMGEDEADDLDLQVPRGNLRDDGSSRSTAQCEGQVRRTGSQDGKRPVDQTAGSDEDPFDLRWSRL